MRPVTWFVKTFRRSALLRNVSWLMLGNVLAKPLWFAFITAACMRYLGVRDYGTLAAVLALSTILTPLSDLGTTLYVTREGVPRGGPTPAEDHDSTTLNVGASTLFSNLLPTRLALAVVTIGVTLALGLALGYESEMMQALGLAALFASGQKLLDYCRAFFRAAERMQHEAASMVVDRLLVVTLGTAALLWAPTPTSVLAGMSLGIGIALVLNLIWVHLRFAPFQSRLLSGAFVRRILRLAAPLAVFTLLALLLGRTAPVLVESILGEQAAGLYGSASRLLEALGAVALVLMGSALPHFASLQRAEAPPRVLRQRLLQTLVICLGGSLAAAGAITLASPLIFQVLDPSGGFSEADALLRVLIWSFPAVTVTALLSAVLLALHEQRFVLGVYAAAVTLSLLAYVLALPRFGVTGAAVVQVIAESSVAVVLVGRGLTATRPHMQSAPAVSPEPPK